jgi:hypothetical protein
MRVGGIQKLIIITNKEITFRWMWSGAHGSTHDSGARGPGFDPTPKPRTAFIWKLSSPFFLTTDLKTIVIHCDVKLK